MKHLENRVEKETPSAIAKLNSETPLITTTTTTAVAQDDTTISKTKTDETASTTTTATATTAKTTTNIATNKASSPLEKSARTTTTTPTNSNKMASDLDESEKDTPKIITICLSDGDGDEPSGGAGGVGGGGNNAVAPQHNSKASKKRRSTNGGASVRPAGNIPPDDWANLKRRKINVPGAPNLPLSAYVRFMNERRESLRRRMPLKTHNEQNKIIAEEWHQLTDQQKSPYISAADADKRSYDIELMRFLTSRPDVLASELAKDKARRSHHENGKKESPVPVSSGHTPATAQQQQQQQQQILNGGKAQNVAHATTTNQTQQKRKRTPTPTNSLAPAVVATGEIPIFTNEFLEHNKVFDLELRGLRKSKTDLEQQNAVLEKHVENMKFGVEKMCSENNELEEKNRLLEVYLLKLKKRLAQAFSGLAIPSEPNGATVDNIDKYMNDLYKMATSNTHGPASLNKAKDIIRKLDLQIQL